MRIAFYAPLKPPNHPVPSGDRRMANLIMRALTLAGHEPVLASTFRGYDGRGEAERQTALAAAGAAEADELIREYRRLPPPERPRLWFTYHLYHKAPDWLGPAVHRDLQIPYCVAEASFAPKQEAGPWAHGHAAVQTALSRAAVIFAMSENDAECLRDVVREPGRLVLLPPFLDSKAYRTGRRCRAELARELGCHPGQPWILVAAMMRPGDKAESYRRLAAALARLGQDDWQLLVVGDGDRRREIEAAYADLGAGRVFFAGMVSEEDLIRFYASADVFAWPAVNEAYGVALLEAQAAGVPVVAGWAGGVPEIVADGETGLLTDPDDVDGFARALRRLLGDADFRRRLGRAAAARAADRHDISVASRSLSRALEEALG